MLSRCFLDFSVGVRASVIGLSQISSFSLYVHSVYRFNIDPDSGFWEGGPFSYTVLESTSRC